MNRPLAPLALVAAFGAALAPPVSAAGLEKSRVAADAAWLAHLDLESLSESTIGRFVLDDGDRHGIEVGDLEDFRRETGLDPRTDILGVTAYGPSGAFNGKGVIIALTTARADEALKRMKEHPEIEMHEIERGGYAIESFEADGETQYLHLRRADEADRRLVVLAASADDLVRALRVIDGDRPSLDRATSSLARESPAEGSILFVNARDLAALADCAPVSDLARLSDQLVLDVGEAKGDVFARLVARATERQDARDVADVLQGMIALGRLVARDEPDLAPLREVTEGITVKASGRRVILELRYDAQTLVDRIEQTEH